MFFVFFFFLHGTIFHSHSLLERGVPLPWFTNKGLVVPDIPVREAPRWLLRKGGLSCRPGSARLPSGLCAAWHGAGPPTLQGVPHILAVVGWATGFGKVSPAEPLLLTASALAKYIVLIKCCFFI